jgi:ppGpp synthetase/RelA/SpoT-type nucleotidyltranferase
MDGETELAVAKILGDWAERLERAEARLRSYLEFACTRLREEPVDFRHMLVDARVKKPPDVVRALHEQGLAPDDVLKVDDLIGGRVVVLTGSDVQVLLDYIEQDKQCPVEDFQCYHIDNESGYRATHIKGWIRSGAERLGCETQIRTTIAHAWAEVSRPDLYRRDVSQILPRMAQTQARALAAAEDVLQLIREEARRAIAAHPEVVAKREGIEEQAPQVVTPEPVRLELEVPAPSIVQPPPKDEVFVQTNPISKGRVDAFRERFLADRRQTAATEILFNRAQALQRAYEWNDKVAAGFNVLTYKGPFVERSNWVPYQTWEFALAAERHLLNRLELLLTENAQPRPDAVELNWPAILARVDELVSDLSDRRYNPSVIVIAGQLGFDMMVEVGLKKHPGVLPDWELPSELHALWIEGSYHSIPILNIRESAAPYALYVADLAAFATLTKYSPAAMFSVDEIDEARAREILERKPKAVVIPEGRPDTLEERLRLLQLRVWLRLYESYGIELRDPQAALQVKLTS